MILFYDYTKVPSLMDRFLRREMPGNYHLVWSLSEKSLHRKMAIRVLRSKRTTVSVAFDTARSRPLPRTLTIVDNTKVPWEHVTRPVIDADEYDMRFIDSFGTFAGLHFKTPTTGLAGFKGKKIRPEWIRRSQGFVVEAKGDPDPVIPVRV